MTLHNAPRIAVTGAAGFVGRYVLAELGRRDLGGFASSRDPGRLADLWPRERSVQLDLDTPGAEAYERLGRPEALIHLAWQGLPNYKSLHHFETELPAQYRFLRGMVDAGLPSLVVAGTCFEYGMQSGPLSESAEARPTNPYGYAKDALRRQLQYLQAVKPFKLTWARLFFVNGEGQAKGSVIPQLREAVARGDATFNMSGGEQLRVFVPVEEAARQLVRLAAARAGHGIVNVCTGKPVSVRGFVEKWLRENGREIKLNLGHYPYPDHEPMAFWGTRDYLDSIPDPAGAQ